MRRIRVIPVLLLQAGGLVKSVKFKNHKYVGDPINAVRIFNDKEVDEIIILDISANPESRGPNIEQIAELAGEAFMPFAYGGGVSTMDQISKIFYAGAEKVVLNTSAIDRPELITQAAKRYGSQSIVVSLDARSALFGGMSVFRDGGRKKTRYSPVELAKKVEALGAGELMVTSIDRDGTFKGFDLDLVHSVAEAVQIPVIACGGAGSVEDLRLAVDKGASAVAAGSFFVYQRPHRAVLISYPSQEELKNHVFSRV